jgi:hypothetical protein
MVMAEIQGGPMAHHQQLSMHHHRGIQPSLVMNHHVDIDCHQTGLEIHPANISKLKIISSYYFNSFCSRSNCE